MALKMGGIIDAIGKFGIMAGTKLQGIFTPNLVPYTADGGINEAELRRYADWLMLVVCMGCIRTDPLANLLGSHRKSVVGLWRFWLTRCGGVFQFWRGLLRRM